MNDQKMTEREDRRVDELLQQQFPAKPSLADDFEQRVMSRVQSEHSRSERKRRLGRVMTAYWMLCGLLAGWVITGAVSSAPEASGTAMSALGMALALVIACLLILGRQSRLKISQLFLRTVV